MTIVKERLKTDRRVIKADGVTMERLITGSGVLGAPSPGNRVGPDIAEESLKTVSRVVDAVYVAS